MNTNEPVEVLRRYAAEHQIQNYEIMEVPAAGVQVGDIVTIQPACYDDLWRFAREVKEPVTSFSCGKCKGWDICNFIFGIDENVQILRRAEV